ncbi:MAG TPA: DUF938 domain-containing protein [Polyangiaceae bacterium]
MKRHAPAADRNGEPILEVIRRFLPDEARVLEIGSGTGQHAAFFTSRTSWVWQPTDADAAAVASIDAYRLEAQNSGFLPPLQLDVRRDPWPAGPFDAVFAANVIHISPWPVCLAVIEGASRVLAPGGLLLFYGPFLFDGEEEVSENRHRSFLVSGVAPCSVPRGAPGPTWRARAVDSSTALAFTAESNAAFDARLRNDDPAWGVRDVSDITAAAREQGVAEPPLLIPMPANNHVLAFRRAPPLRSEL